MRVYPAKGEGARPASSRTGGVEFRALISELGGNERTFQSFQWWCARHARTVLSARECQTQSIGVWTVLTLDSCVEVFEHIGYPTYSRIVPCVVQIWRCGGTPHDNAITSDIIIRALEGAKERMHDCDMLGVGCT